MSPFIFPVRVYWEDTDAGGIVYYANYLKFMERARTELLRSMGIHQNRMAQEEGVMFTIVSVSVDYLLPARLDDWLVVTCTILAEGRASFAFSQEVYRQQVGGELLVRARARAACLDCATLRPRRLPASLLKALGTNNEE